MTEGERWTAGELRALRERKFAPGAWKRFLARSFVRAAETRRGRPALARQATIWSVCGLAAGLAAVAGARRAGIAAPRPAVWAGWWLSTAAMLEWHLGMVEGSAGEAREWLSPADALTLVRLGLVPFIAAQGARPPADAAPFAVLLAAAAVTDVADGAVARRHGSTRLGRDLDKVADVLVDGAGVRAACRAGWIRPGVALVALARHAVPVAVVSAGYFATGRRPPRSSFGETRPTVPALFLAGLMLSPAAPRVANGLVGAGALAALVLGRPRPRTAAAA